MRSRLFHKVVRELIDYNKLNGALTWKHRPRKYFKRDQDCACWNRRWAGKPAFNSEDSRGYLHGPFLGRDYKAHRIAWLWVTGGWPDQIDHERHDRNNNAWYNLNDVTNGENHRNMKRAKNNTTGVTGVTIVRGAYRAQIEISVNGKRKNIILGSFPNLKSAAAARAAANHRYGFHKNHGQPLEKEA